MMTTDLAAGKEPRLMTRARPRHWPRALTTVFWFALAWGLLIGLWELGAAQGFLNDRILPPSETIPFLLSGGANVGFGVQKTGLIDAVLVTLGRIGIGLSCGLGLAVLIGALIVEFVPARRLFLPIVQTIAPISPVAWIPFAIAIVGIGDPAAIFVVVMAIFGSMAVAAVAAFDAVPGEYVKVATTLGAGRLRIWFRVLLPGIMTMTRMSLFGAWMAVLAGGRSRRPLATAQRWRRGNLRRRRRQLHRSRRRSRPQRRSPVPWPARRRPRPARPASPWSRH